MLLDIIPLNEFIEAKKRPAIERAGVVPNLRPDSVSRETHENTEIYSRARGPFSTARGDSGDFDHQLSFREVNYATR